MRCELLGCGGRRADQEDTAKCFDGFAGLRTGGGEARRSEELYCCFNTAAQSAVCARMIQAVVQNAAEKLRTAPHRQTGEADRLTVRRRREDVNAPCATHARSSETQSPTSSRSWRLARYFRNRVIPAGRRLHAHPEQSKIRTRRAHTARRTQGGVAHVIVALVHRSQQIGQSQVDDVGPLRARGPRKCQLRVMRSTISDSGAQCTELGDSTI